MNMKWQRKCQECGYKGYYKEPNLNDKNEGWRDTKCRKCKSEALDFGHAVDTSKGETNEYDD